MALNHIHAFCAHEITEPENSISQRKHIRNKFVPGRMNIKCTYSVDPQNKILLSLHIILDRIENFVKTMDKKSTAFKY